mgnify:CR=1 FL=1
MKTILVNWKTTLPGVITLIGVVYQAWTTKTVDWQSLQAALVGIGLISAKDFDVIGTPK